MLNELIIDLWEMQKQYFYVSLGTRISGFNHYFALFIIHLDDNNNIPIEAGQSLSSLEFTVINSQYFDLQTN